MVGNPYKKCINQEKDQRNNLDILEQMEKLGILLLKSHGNHLTLVGNEDLKI